VTVLQYNHKLPIHHSRQSNTQTDQRQIFSWDDFRV